MWKLNYLEISVPISNQNCRFLSARGIIPHPSKCFAPTNVQSLVSSKHHPDILRTWFQQGRFDRRLPGDVACVVFKYRTVHVCFKVVDSYLGTTENLQTVPPRRERKCTELKCRKNCTTVCNFLIGFRG